MRRCFIFGLFSFSMIFGKMKIERILETTDVREYNRWVMTHRREHPGLKSVYILAEQIGVREGIRKEIIGTKIKSYRIHYYDANGNEVKTEVVEGHNMEIIFSPEHDRMIIKEWKDEPPYGKYYYTVYDKYGNKLFTKVDTTIAFLLTLKNRYMLELTSMDGAPPVWAGICNNHGIVMGEWKNISFEKGIRVSQDKKKALIYGLGGFEMEPDFLIFIDVITGKEISRKEFMPDLKKGEVFGLTGDMDENAQRIVVSFNDKVYVYNRNWNLLFKIDVPTYPGNPGVGLSPDGKYLATFGSDTVRFFDLEKGILLWKEVLKYAGRPKYLKVLRNGKGVLVGTKWPAWVYLLDDKGRLIKYENLGSKEIRKYIKGVPISRVLYETLEYTLDVIGDKVVIKVFNRPGSPIGFYSIVWRMEE